VPPHSERSLRENVTTEKVWQILAPKQAPQDEALTEPRMENAGSCGDYRADQQVGIHPVVCGIISVCCCLTVSG
jgi:hypothetical protein